MNKIKTWEERINDHPRGTTVSVEKVMQAEIDELRAALVNLRKGMTCAKNKNIVDYIDAVLGTGVVAENRAELLKEERVTSATLLHRLLEYVCSVPDDGVYAGVLYQERNSLIKEAQTTLAKMAAIELPPIGPHDHPEAQTLMWSKTELAAIEEYRRQAFAQGTASRSALQKISTERLPPDMQKILHDNLWELYESA